MKKSEKKAAIRFNGDKTLKYFLASLIFLPLMKNVVPVCMQRPAFHSGNSAEDYNFWNTNNVNTRTLFYDSAKYKNGKIRFLKILDKPLYPFRVVK